eukprot:m.171859 g.171859  ORF g.171859 m.171859 type:complete len:85 (-) comp15358_c1_seq3:766-1020(-)
MKLIDGKEKDSVVCVHDDFEAIELYVSVYCVAKVYHYDYVFLRYLSWFKDDEESDVFHYLAFLYTKKMSCVQQALNLVKVKMPQ